MSLQLFEKVDQYNKVVEQIVKLEAQHNIDRLDDSG